MPCAPNRQQQAVLPGKLISGFSGFIVEGTDWFTFFIYASAMGIPGIVLALVVVRRQRQLDEAS